jgi:glycine betaine/choline ABC-type transport system substrate-binding protein
MGNLMNSGAAALAKKQAEQQRIRSLADLARQQGEVDQAGSSGGSGFKGRGLLTFLSGSGDSLLG